MMTDNEVFEKKLFEKGFKTYDPTSFDPDGVVQCFQKRYDDEAGKKYFITVRKWGSVRHPRTGDVFPENYEYGVQLYRKCTHAAVDLLFHCDWDIDSVESCLESLWATGCFEHYEAFDNE